MFEFARDYAVFLSLTTGLLLFSFLIRIAFLWIARPSWIDFFANPGLSLIFKPALYFLIAVAVLDFQFNWIWIQTGSLWVLFQGAELKEHLSWRTTSSYSMSDRKTQKIFNRMIYLLPCSILTALIFRLIFQSNSFADKVYHAIQKNILMELVSSGLGLAALLYFFCLIYKYQGMISHLSIYASGFKKLKKNQ